MTFRDCLNYYNPGFPDFVGAVEIPEDWGSHLDTKVLTTTLPFKHFWVRRKLTFLLVPGCEMVIWIGPKSWMCGRAAWLVFDHSNLLLLLKHYHLALGYKAQLLPGNVHEPIIELLADLPILPKPVAPLLATVSPVSAASGSGIETTVELL